MLPSTDEQARWWEEGRRFEREYHEKAIQDLKGEISKLRSSEEALERLTVDLREALYEVSARDADSREQLAKLWHYRPGAIRRRILEWVVG